ncbi:MAG: adenylyl-sulfate kinase, partial [Burkholderiales bacterium]|nr:adenylyl-sulfate kinase [Burkholderiales bacterium]
MTPAPLRFITCGSVDDGKSTLIGRLLHDCGRVPEDQWQSLERDSLRLGSVPGGAPDFALLLDGLQAEREQGITIDCAYRYFSTPRRRFIVADAPGHEQYTRNMATGASTADAAVVLVDARKGIVVQTRRHARIIGLLGVRDVVLAVNKMDLVDWGQAAFDAVAAEFASLAGVLGIPRVASIPISALNGDNVARRSGACRWYTGPSLLEHLEGITGDACRADGAFRLPIQHVIRDGQDFRGYGGRIVGAPMRKGDRVRLAPSGVESSVRS